MEFDCKVATVTMKPGATLAQEAVTAALTKKGWGLSEFKEGGGEKLTVHLFQVTGTKAADHAALARRLQSELEGAQEVAIDSAGNAVVVLRKDGQLTEAALATALAAAGEGWAARSFETKQWPKTFATYAVSVPGMAGDAEAAKVREALRALPKVLVVQVFQDAKSARIRLNEPCERIAADVADALKAHGLESKTEIVGRTAESKDR